MLLRPTSHPPWLSVRKYSSYEPAVRKIIKPKHIPVPKQPPNVSLLERVKITMRRIKKAERDERMDITMALTEVKTFRPGFTRPRDIRATNWFPGGAYTEKKIYETPPAEAYEPHTVFLLESRYPVRHGIGRVDSHEFIVGTCRESDWLAIVKKFNSAACPQDAKLLMDNAYWPWLEGRRIKHNQWWEKGEDPEKIIQAVKDGTYDPNESVYEKVPSENASLNAGKRPSENNELNSVTDGSQPHKSDSLETDTSSDSNSSRDLASEPPTKPRTRRNLADIKGEADRQAFRKTYFSHVKNEPFWRPLLAVTLATRPLAVTYARLSRALPRGLAFYASLSNDDRKCVLSYSTRMRNLRMDRMFNLAYEMALVLHGHRGGIVGLRYNMEQKGRGINGEQLEDQLPERIRTLKVGIGAFYRRAEDYMELYRDLAQGAVVYELDEWGCAPGQPTAPLETVSDDAESTPEETGGEAGVQVERDVEMEDSEQSADQEAEDDEDVVLPPGVTKDVSKLEVRAKGLKGDQQKAFLEARVLALAHQWTRRHRSVDYP